MAFSKKIFILFLLALLFSNLMLAKSNEKLLKKFASTSLSIIIDSNQTYFKIEKMPVFPGGEGAFIDYIQMNVNYPLKARKKGIQGTIYVGFVIDQNGKPTEVKIERGGLGYGLEEEAMRVIRSMPNWTPGSVKDVPARVQYTFPIKFKLK